MNQLSRHGAFRLFLFGFSLATIVISLGFHVALAKNGIFADTPDATSISFRKEKIRVGSKLISVEVAENEEQSQRGLMFRHQMAENSGMIFIFPDEQPRTFWMKNTFIPLTIGYFDRNQTLVDIQDMQPVKSEMDSRPPTYPSTHPAQFALEMNQGWFQKNGIKIGTRFSFLDRKSNAEPVGANQTKTKKEEKPSKTTKN